jgi:hypothetical protein
MAMSKIIFWIVVFFIVLFALRLLNVSKSRAREKAEREKRESRKALPTEETVRCASCGVYLPKNDARLGPSGYHCGDPACAKRR